MKKHILLAALAITFVNTPLLAAGKVLSYPESVSSKDINFVKSRIKSLGTKYNSEVAAGKMTFSEAANALRKGEKKILEEFKYNRLNLYKAARYLITDNRSGQRLTKVNFKTDYTHMNWALNSPDISKWMIDGKDSYSVTATVHAGKKKNLRGPSAKLNGTKGVSFSVTLVEDIALKRGIRVSVNSSAYFRLKDGYANERARLDKATVSDAL